MALELLRADLVVTAAGSTLWEAFCLGRPVAAVQVAANQAQVYARLVADGTVIGLGSAPMTADDVDPTRLDAAKDRARAFVDSLPDGVPGAGDHPPTPWLPVPDRRLWRAVVCGESPPRLGSRLLAYKRRASPRCLMATRFRGRGGHQRSCEAESPLPTGG